MYVYIYIYIYTNRNMKVASPAPNFENKIWLRPNRVTGSVEGRYRHSASHTKSAMYIFGGINQAQKRFNDLHEFIFET